MNTWVDAGGVALRYRLEGNGPTHLIFLHEMGGMLENWEDVVGNLLADTTLKIARYDLRGCGLSEKIHSELSLDELVSDLDQFMTAIGDLVQPVLVGCALGSAIALRYASLFPERVRGVIACSPPVPSQAGRPPGGESDLEEAARIILKQGVGARLRPRVDRYFHEDFRSDPSAYVQYRLRAGVIDPHSYLALNRLMQAIDLADDLPRLRVPVLLLAGGRDRIRPVSDVRWAANRIAGSEYVELDTGHFMSVLSPALVAGQVARFIRSHGQRPFAPSGRSS